MISQDACRKIRQVTNSHAAVSKAKRCAGSNASQIVGFGEELRLPLGHLV
jgi:hypothetical protein